MIVELRNTHIMLKMKGIASDQRTALLKQKLALFDKMFQFKYCLMNIIDEDNIVIPRYFYTSEIAKIYGGFNLVDKSGEFIPYDTLSFKWNKEFTEKNIIQTEAINFLDTNDNAILNLRTGSGKTYASIKTMFLKKAKSLLIMEKTDLIDQWIGELKKFLIIDDKEILVVNSTKLIDNIISGKKDVTGVKIFLTTYKSMGSLVERGYDIYDEFIRKIKVGVKIMDEIHRFMHAVFLIESASNIRYNYYLSATVGRTDYMENKLLRTILPTKTIFTEILDDSQKYHTVYCDSYNTLPDPKTMYKIEEGRRFGFDIHSYCDYISENESVWRIFAAKVVELIKLVNRKSTHKILIVMPEINMIEQMYNVITDRTDLGDVTVTTYYGDNKEREKLSCDIIIATGKSVTDAIHIEDLEIIINTVPYTSKIVADQLIGRIRMKEDRIAVYIDLVDKGFPRTLQQRESRMKHFKKTAKKILLIS